MWFRRRDDGGATALAEDPGASLGDEPVALFAEIERLSAANRRRAGGDHARERALLTLRNRAAIALVQSAPDPGGPFARPEPDAAALDAVAPGPSGLPEIGPAQLTAGLLRAAILTHGCLLVRGLVTRPDAERLAAQIDRAFAERERHDTGQRFDDGWFSGFAPDPRHGEPLSREWIKSGGGLLAVDSPRLSFAWFELLRGAGLPTVIGAYLGEAPLIAADKTTLRRADPSVGGAWHQDGKFMGEVNALNVWLSLSRCGDEAPGLDIVPKRIDHHVTTQTDEAWLDNMVSQRMAEQAAGDTPILRPIFEPGDALLFDELFLHKTASDPAMPRPRFAVESWFFGPSGFPADYAPLAV
jgi:hypothetical protein